MYKRIVVPTTGADSSWRAVRVGDALANRYGAELELYSVVSSLGEKDERERLLAARLAPERAKSPMVKVTVEVDRDTVAKTIAAHLAAIGSALPVMATAAHGRSEAILGSVAEELLAVTCGPLVVVGPHADVDSFVVGGDMVVPVDGSKRSEAALWPATAFAVELGIRPWITSVLDPAVRLPTDLNEGGYASRLAARLHDEIHREVEHDVLHDHHPAHAIVRFADTLAASLVVASTHGRTGLARLALGSVAMGVVHQARCPVVLVRPLAPESAEAVSTDAEADIEAGVS